jgi:hypothetical protein
VAGPTVTGPSTTAWAECESLTPAQAREAEPNTIVCIYSWLSYTGRGDADIVLEILDPDQSSIYSTRYDIHRNPLAGARMGYRIWTGKAVRSPGEHQILIYDPKVGKEKELICRTTFDVG